MTINAVVLIVAIIAVCGTVCYLTRCREKRLERNHNEWLTFMSKVAGDIKPFLEGYVNRH